MNLWSRQKQPEQRCLTKMNPDARETLDQETQGFLYAFFDHRAVSKTETPSFQHSFTFKGRNSDVTKSLRYLQ